MNSPEATTKDSNKLDLEDLGSKIKANVERGIILLLEHFRAAGQPLFPRKMSTFLQYGITVNSIEDILRECRKSSYIDCRLNAYPVIVDDDIEAGLVAPSILFCDIDLSAFTKSGLSFEACNNAMLATITNIKKHFNNHNNLTPMVLWTGNGYHLYVVINSKPLNLNQRASKLCPPNTEISKEFLRFAELFLTDGKCDPEHSATLSFKSCLLRIPFTFNSKCIDCPNGQDPQVKIINESIGVGELNDQILRQFRFYLCDIKIVYNQRQERLLKYSKLKSDSNSNSEKIAWIEELLQTPLMDHRKYCIWRILTPYLLNIRKISTDQAFNIINEWLDKCNQLKRLDFDSDRKIQDSFDRIEEEYLPIARKKLLTENSELFVMLEAQKIIS